MFKFFEEKLKHRNETFNTLKNQGYHFEHNFGHGEQHLSYGFAHLMQLAFLIDQLQGLCCNVFQQALKKMKRPLYFWERLRAVFFDFRLPNWMTFYQAIISPKIDLPIILHRFFVFRGSSFLKKNLNLESGCVFKWVILVWQGCYYLNILNIRFKLMGLTA